MIKFDNISVKADKKFILKNFSLIINEFDKVLIYGKSGLGKTTLFRLIMGFVTPCVGDMYYKGKRIDKNTVWEIRKSTAYVPQNLDLTDEKVKTYINDLLSLKVNTEKNISEKEITQLFDYFELPPDTQDKNYKDLSGGEKQRVAIIMAILLDRELFLLDEVTSALSGELKQKVIDYFAKIPEKTVVIISHDVEWMQNQNIKKISMEEL
ncbi:MAG: ABC transporter ATP-binding protein [Treponema sp.]|nr:MAG: ABC transporter ATP-binding protein [Treponema sp.]